MSKIEELKDYLRCVGNSIYDSDEVEKKFEIIADILLNWCIIRFLEEKEITKTLSHIQEQTWKAVNGSFTLVE